MLKGNNAGEHRRYFGVGELDIPSEYIAPLNRSHVYFIMDGAFTVTKGVTDDTVA